MLATKIFACLLGNVIHTNSTELFRETTKYIPPGSLLDQNFYLPTRQRKPAQMAHRAEIAGLVVRIRSYFSCSEIHSCYTVHIATHFMNGRIMYET